MLSWWYLDSQGIWNNTTFSQILFLFTLKELANYLLKTLRFWGLDKLQHFRMLNMPLFESIREWYSTSVPRQLKKCQLLNCVKKKDQKSLNIPSVGAQQQNLCAKQLPPTSFSSLVHLALKEPPFREQASSSFTVITKEKEYSKGWEKHNLKLFALMI